MTTNRQVRWGYSEDKTYRTEPGDWINKLQLPKGIHLSPSGIGLQSNERELFRWWVRNESTDLYDVIADPYTLRARKGSR